VKQYYLSCITKTTDFHLSNYLTPLCFVLKGGAIGNAPRARMTLKNNIFKDNVDGVPVFLHGKQIIV
jgi:hypothetical protein